MRRTRIAHLTSVHDPFDDRIFLKECKSLAGAGYDVTLVAPHDKDELVDGVRIKAVPRLEGRFSRMTLTVWRVCREALRVGAELYHFHDPELIPVGLLLRARGKKVIYDIHEDVPRDILGKYYISRWIRRPLAWLVERLENSGCPRFSVLIAAWPAIFERFRKLNENTMVLHNYAILGEFTPHIDVDWGQRRSSLVYMGGLVPNRGIRKIVEAMNLLPSSLPATLELAGRYSPESFRDELIGLPGWERVNELGFLSRTEMGELLGRVRAGLVLYLPEPGHIQAQPNKLSDYMSAGIPVIASDFPLWREMVEGAGCGLLVDPLKPKAIAEAIEYILTHQAEAEAMGHRGRKAVEQRYNWGIEESKLLKCYEDLQGFVNA